MSAPNTNLEKERRRHRGPLIGMLLGVVFVLGLLLFWLGSDASTGTAPGTSADPAEAGISAQEADTGSVPTEADPMTTNDAPAVVPPPAAAAD